MQLSTGFIDALSERPVGTMFWWWITIVVACGVAFWALHSLTGSTLMSNGRPIAHGARGLIASLYFSAVTATSIGYGDIVPIGPARALAIAEGIAGLILFGCVVSKFVSRRQDQLIAEIHHIAFEDRLGRVRTNLHLVRTEVQATARLCEGREIAPPEAVARVETAAVVFVGELSAVHELLYRPAGAVDEAMLEAILAGLASVLREFSDVLRCIRLDERDWPQALRVSLRTMSRLAREICGECVPRNVAPPLREQMDAIQRLAGQIVTS